jgi:hypothetical protein
MSSPAPASPAFDPALFLSRLEARGVRLWLDEAERLRYRAPTGLVTPTVVARIRRVRSHLVPLLRRSEQQQQHQATNGRQAGEPENEAQANRFTEPDPLIREAYLSTAASMGRLPACLSPPLRLPSGRVVSNVNVFVRGSVARWRHAQAQEDRQALAYAGMTWQDVAAQEAADLACLMDRFAAAEAIAEAICTDTCGVRDVRDPRDFAPDILANAHDRVD